jgi:transcriptional regulator with XRE-family HTH domain
MRKIIGERLEEERARLGKKKGEMAAIGGVAGSAYTNYHEGTRVPDAEFLAAIAAEGVDVQYILTGVRSLNPACDPKSAIHQDYLVKSSAEAINPLKLDKYLAGDLLNILHAVALGNGDAVEEAMADYANSELTVAEKDLLAAYRQASEVDRTILARVAQLIEEATRDESESGEPVNIEGEKHE